MELRLKELRINNSLSQKELAEKICTTNKNIWAYENGVATPPIEMLEKIATFFNVSIDYLIGREDDFGNITLKVPTQKNYSEKTLKLIECFEKLSPRMQDTFLDYIQSITEDIDTIYQEKKTKK